MRDFPGRGEAVMVFAAHPEATFCVQIPFTREGGALRFGRTSRLEGDQLKGGLADILKGGA